MSSPYPNDLAYLQDEMHWIEARCQRIAMQAPQASRRPKGAAAEPDDDAFCDGPRGPTRLALAKRLEEERRARIDARLAAGPPCALDRLCDTYGLDAFERTVLLLATAPVFSRRFEKSFERISPDEVGFLTVEVAFAFMDLSFTERITRRHTFSRRGCLYANDLLVHDSPRRRVAPEELLTTDLRLASRTFAYLVGDAGIASDLLDVSTIETPLTRFDQVVLGDGEKQRLLSVLDRHDAFLHYRKAWGFDDIIRYGRGITMLFHGPPGTGKTMTAHAVAHHIGKRVMNVDIPNFMEHNEGNTFLPALFREARLQDAVLFFDECESLFGARGRGNVLMTVLLTELERFEGVAILATNLPELLDGALDRRMLVRVAFPEPDRDARLAIWHKLLPSKAPLADDVDLRALATRYELTGGYIKNAVLMAVAAAVHDHVEPVLTMAHLTGAAAAQSRRVMQAPGVARWEPGTAHGPAGFRRG